MVRFLRVVVAVVGVVLVFGSSVLTWVNVEIDEDAFIGLAEEVADGSIGDAVDHAVLDAVDGDIDTGELFDEAGDAIDAARDFIPEPLLDATLNGQTSYDLFGFGFLLVGLAIAATAAGVFWAITATRWVRWIGVLMAIVLLALAVLTPISIIATDAALDTFLPEDWKPFSPSFDVTTAPLGAIGGSVLITLGLMGRSPRRDNTPAAPPPLPPPSDFTFTS